MGTTSYAAVSIGAAGFLVFAGMTDAAEIKVIASGGFRAAYLELVPGFERVNEHKVATVFAGSVDIMKRMQAGETCDLVIMPGASIDEWIKHQCASRSVCAILTHSSGSGIEATERCACRYQ
jgi:molybdate transport system substrate-binding protein